MGAMKSLLMEIESLIWEAMDRGAKTKEDIYAYVCANAGNVSQVFVYSVIDSIDQWPDDEEYYRNSTLN